MKHILFFIILSLVSINAISAETTPIVKVIIPFAPGGGADIAFKHFQQYAESTYNMQMVPVYKAGADGVIGMNELAASPADGSVIGFGTIATVAMHKAKNTEYTFDYVTVVRKSVMALVSNPTSTVKNINDLEKEIRSKTTTTTFAYGSPTQKIALNLLFSLNKSSPTREFIPYKGSGPMLNDLLGNHVNIAIVPYQVVKQHIENNKLSVISISARRDYKELKEYINLYNKYQQWDSADGYVIVLPKGTTPQVYKTWSNILKAYMQSEKTITDFAEDFSEPSVFGPEHLAQQVNSVSKLLKDN